jgi:hypothetical protein
VTITAKRLEELGACQDQVDAFRAIWGDGPAPMTVETALEHAQVFNWNWAADKLLSDAAWEEYLRAEAAAWDEYLRATPSAYAEYARAVASARAEYKRAWAAAWAEYDRATALASAEYERACARAFAEAYIKQETAK